MTHLSITTVLGPYFLVGVAERLIHLPVLISWKTAEVRFRLTLDPWLPTTNAAALPGVPQLVCAISRWREEGRKVPQGSLLSRF